MSADGQHVADHFQIDDDSDDNRYLIRIFKGNTDRGVCYVGEFKIYQLVNIDGCNLPRRKGAINGWETVSMSEINGAEVTAHGSVKWDGCADWDIDNNDTMLHHCGASGLTALLRAITLAHKLAAAVPTTDDCDRDDWLALEAP
jgi:hypothetical protein